MQSVAVPASCNHAPRLPGLVPAPGRGGRLLRCAGPMRPPQARSLPPVTGDSRGSRLRGSHSCWSEHAGSLQSRPLPLLALGPEAAEPPLPLTCPGAPPTRLSAVEGGPVLFLAQFIRSVTHFHVFFITTYCWQRVDCHRLGPVH
ncbi:hypothetical protein NDU88_004611 [Pleurodeles waltl]|uniref:Uncharacterized protein n=1 Tax=Pleurodeles waltl TaxID=8319 RepID=A0AAV7VKT4_PLEWA|nr:hypothetical protein NDU88_004611 [Pleurodeles waltl]